MLVLVGKGNPLCFHLLCEDGLAGHLPGGKLEPLEADVLDRPDLKVLQVGHQGLELPCREGGISLEMLPPTYFAYRDAPLFFCSGPEVLGQSR